MLFFEILTYIFQVQLKPLLHELYLYIFQGKEAAKDYKEKFTADLFNAWSVEFNMRTMKNKKELFDDLKSIKSRDPELAKCGKIRILEIGIGSGANLAFYPRNCLIVAVDPNRHYEDHIKNNMQKFPDMTLEKFVVAFGENMNEIEAESIDVVVTTLVHCSVQSSEKVLNEIHRVLVPGGRYFYLEHILDEKNTWNYYRQELFTWTHFWQILFDNCHFMKQDQLLTQSAYLPSVWSKKFHLSTSGLWVYQIIYPHISGVNEKPDV